MRRWYVVSTLPQQEARAEENLVRQGYTAWLPRFRKLRRHARRTETVLAPLFPGYLFVALDTDTDQWRSINGTFGVMRLICNGEAPLAMPERFVDEIMARRDEHGTIVLPPRAFAPGESVRVSGGPFADLEGLYQGMSGRDRVFLLFNLLGRKVRASVPLVELAA